MVWSDLALPPWRRCPFWDSWVSSKEGGGSIYYSSHSSEHWGFGNLWIVFSLHHHRRAAQAWLLMQRSATLTFGHWPSAHFTFVYFLCIFSHNKNTIPRETCYTTKEALSVGIVKTELIYLIRGLLSGFGPQECMRRTLETNGTWFVLTAEYLTQPHRKSFYWYLSLSLSRLS